MAIDEYCPICCGQLIWEHDHRENKSGLDDGPYLDRKRKKPKQKSTDEIRAIRKKAWATRRAKYGQYGHR